MAIFPHPISTASCAPHQHRMIPSSPERLQRERRLALELLSGFKQKAHEHNLNLVDLSKDEFRLLGRAIYENSGLVQGFVAGALTLLTLRRGPIYMTRYLQKYHHQWGPDLYKSNNKTTSNVSNSPFHSYNNISPVAVPPPNESPFMKTGWWLIDLTLSCAGAVMAATATTNQEELFMTLSQIPRVLPESRIADCFCPQAMLMLQELKSRKRSDDDTTAALLESPQSVMLQAMMDCTTACQQRENRNEFLAQRNREEQGIMNDNVVNDDDAGDSSTFGTAYNDASTTSNWDDTTRG
jgi:hypothetical protein